MRLSEAISGEQVLRAHIEDESFFEAGGVDSFCGFDAEVECVDWAEDFVDQSNLGLVLQVDSPVEFGEAGHISALDNEVILGFVQKCAIGDHI